MVFDQKGDGMDINMLIEQGRRKVEARKLQEQLADEELERKNKAGLEAERAKFVAEAIKPLMAACAEISIGEIGEINSYTWEKGVWLSAPLCTTVHAWFGLEGRTGAFNPIREERTWKLKHYWVPYVELDGAAVEGNESWTAREIFWSRGYSEATEVAELDEALALASDRFVEYALLEEKAKERNEAVKAERAARMEREKKLVEAQQAAFHPFAWYVVQYAVVATDDEGNREADQASFTCLSDHPGADGYFTTAYGKRVKPGFVTLLERMVCIDSEHLPYWCPTMETEFGTIRVPPKDADQVMIPSHCWQSG